MEEKKPYTEEYIRQVINRFPNLFDMILNHYQYDSIIELRGAWKYYDILINDMKLNISALTFKCMFDDIYDTLNTRKEIKLFNVLKIIGDISIW